jgi:hypothetical protein
MSTQRQSTILISGMIAADPFQGGATWAVLQYLLGFQQLGHEVYFVEPVAAAALRPVGAPLADSVNAAYFRQVMADFGVGEISALLLSGTRQTVGLPYRQLCAIARRADVLVNISGMLTDETLISRIPVRVYLDLDPAFNQLWHAVEGIDMRFADHSHFVTVGLTLGQPDCPVPTCGREWITTLQPVVLAQWPLATHIEYDALTTVANWRGYGSIHHAGVHYGQKAHSLRPLMALPTLTDEQLLLALAIHPGEVDDLAALHANGWRLLDPAQMAPTPTDYRRFIQGSKAEFGIAKSGYVAARCGWFSDRSVCYLASGRPVLAQETGFSRFLPTGAGLFAFTTVDDVLAGIETLQRDYAGQARAARTLAAEYFDSDKVLHQLLEQVGRKK